MERASIWLKILEISIQAYIFLCNIDGSRVTCVLLGVENAQVTQILGDKCAHFFLNIILHY